MSTIFARHRILCALGILLFAIAARAHDDDDDDGRVRWFSAWTISIGARMTTTSTGANFAPDVNGSTVRMIVRPTISGRAVRVKIENTMGQSPVVFSRAFIGELGSGAALVPGTNRRLTFGGKAGVTLNPGTGAYSDPVRFRVEAFRRLAVSLEVVTASDVSGHQLGLATNYIAKGAVGASASGAGFTAVPENAGNFPVYWVAAVDVASSTASGTIVALGDSITDGRCSTRDPATGVIPPDIYNRWTDVLATRLHALDGKRAPAIANEGIAGNRVVSGGNGPPALERLDRDVLDRAGIRWVIFYEGTNDITGGASAATLIAGMQEVIDRVHAKGVPIFGATVVPRGRPATVSGWTPAMEAVRLEVNHWMRTEANFDGLIEFAALLQGPIESGTMSESLWPAYNCFDYTHPNATGLRAMGNLIDPGLFKNPSAW